MAFNSILRTSASRVAPIAARLIGGKRHFYRHPSALFSPAAVVTQSNLSGELLPTSFTSGRHYSSSPLKVIESEIEDSDESLLKVIESEIVFAEESDVSNEVQEAPEGFPFKIEDNRGQQTISLSRQYQGETINVEVHMPDLITGVDNDDNDSNDDNEKPSQSHIPLVVRVAKSSGPILEFGVTASPDEISIDCLSVKDPKISEDQIAYEGPDFSDLDENLQKAFHKYLEIRGIKPSTTNFLQEYMLKKDSIEYVAWLKNLKKFVQA